MNASLRTAVVVVVTVASATLGGCGSPEAASAAATAERFAQLAPDDAAAACDLLAPRTLEKVTEEGEGSCPDGLQAADLPAGSAGGAEGEPEIAGHTAKVTTAGQTIFLSLFDDGWKVLAAGCTRSSEDLAEPYDCAVEGN
jgi:hypothetical protein